VLKLVALDAEDLAVISAQMQDAVFRLGDIGYLKARRKFALVGNRFAWDEGSRRRCRTGLQFGRVMAVKTNRIRQDDPDAVVSLLAITFEEKAAPSGDIVLSFSGGGTIRLAVECVEAEMNDFGSSWEAIRTPTHETGGEDH